MMEIREVNVVIKGGRVFGAYSAHSDILVNVIDLDIQDEDEFEELNAEVAAIIAEQNCLW